MGAEVLLLRAAFNAAVEGLQIGRNAERNDAHLNARAQNEEIPKDALLPQGDGNNGSEEAVGERVGRAQVVVNWTHAHIEQHQVEFGVAANGCNAALRWVAEHLIVDAVAIAADPRVLESAFHIGDHQFAELVGVPLVLHSGYEHIECGPDGAVAGDHIVHVSGGAHIEAEVLQTPVHVVVGVEERSQETHLARDQEFLAHVAGGLCSAKRGRKQQYEGQTLHSVFNLVRFICHNES